MADALALITRYAITGCYRAGKSYAALARAFSDACGRIVTLCLDISTERKAALTE